MRENNQNLSDLMDNFEDFQEESVLVVPERVEKSNFKKFINRLIGIVGELLITAGVLIGLFILWQVWWTNVEANAQLDSDVSAFNKEYGEPLVKIGAPQEGEPPVMDEIAYNTVGGIIHIPAFGYNYSTPIRGGVTTQVLDTGAFGHYQDTVMPGAIGNSSWAVHRDMRGSRMYDADKLVAGDAVIVETEDVYYVYKIVNTHVVKPTDVWVISADPFVAENAIKEGREPGEIEPSRRLLTITTCHPLYTARERLIVHAEFSHWVKRSDGMPEELFKRVKKDSTTVSQGDYEQITAFGVNSLQHLVAVPTGSTNSHIPFVNFAFQEEN